MKHIHASGLLLRQFARHLGFFFVLFFQMHKRRRREPIKWLLCGEGLTTRDVNVMVSKMEDRVCRRVTVVDLSRNAMDEFPEQLFRLTNLATLVLSDNALSGALPDLSRLSGSLMSLSLSNNAGMTSVTVSGLTQLRILDLRGTRISPLYEPPPKLSMLYLPHVPVRSFPLQVMSHKDVHALCNALRTRAVAVCLLVLRRNKLQVLMALPVDIVKQIAKHVLYFPRRLSSAAWIARPLIKRHKK